MTIYKFFLISTDNYNTYLILYFSRKCVDWLLAFQSKDKIAMIDSGYNYEVEK